MNRSNVAALPRVPGFASAAPGKSDKETLADTARLDDLPQPNKSGRPSTAEHRHGRSTMSVNATHYEAIPTFPKKKSKNVVHAIVETAKNSPHKYALKKKYGIIALKEVLPDGMHWPYDYGFIPGTLAPDGDPLDILVLTQQGLFPGCMVSVRVLGAVREKKNKVENDRLIAVPLPSKGAPQLADDYRDISDVPKSLMDEIKDFLKKYSQRQGNRVKIRSIVGAKKAMQVVRQSERSFKRS
jgi:inorganic pyrophosphatase